MSLIISTFNKNHPLGVYDQPFSEHLKMGLPYILIRVLALLFQIVKSDLNQYDSTVEFYALNTIFRLQNPCKVLLFCIHSYNLLFPTVNTIFP